MAALFLKVFGLIWGRKMGKLSLCSCVLLLDLSLCFLPTTEGKKSVQGVEGDTIFIDGFY